VGIISVVGIPEEAMQTLAARMPSLTRKTPFITCRFKAVWLRPQLMCEVEYKEWSRSKQLLKPQFRQLLAEIDVK
jgi:ATP-dependent DNA ligase